MLELGASVVRNSASDCACVPMRARGREKERGRLER
jgi:hypothetical protein